MKFSSSDIRQHPFKKSLMGADKEEVRAFLDTVATEWERVNDENKMLRMQLEIAEKELSKLKDAESSIFSALKAAEESKVRVMEEAQDKANQLLQDAKKQSDDLVVEGKKKAAMFMQDVDNKARFVREEAAGELKNCERDLKGIEKYRDTVIDQLRTMMGAMNETLNRYEKKFPKDSIKDKLDDLLSIQIEEAAKTSARASVRRLKKSDDNLLEHERLEE